MNHTHSPCILVVDDEMRYGKQLTHWLPLRWRDPDVPVPEIVAVRDVIGVRNVFIARPDSICCVISNLLLSPIPGADYNGAGVFTLVREHSATIPIVILSPCWDQDIVRYAGMEDVPLEAAGGPRRVDSFGTSWNELRWLLSLIT